MPTLDTVIVGAGQAGPGASYFLQQNDLKHILFERERIGEKKLSNVVDRRIWGKAPLYVNNRINQNTRERAVTQALAVTRITQ
jgi:flavin-dependent dehydrogenase